MARLLDAGGDPSLATRDGRNALDIAVQQNRGETVELLIERGAAVTRGQLAFAADQNYFALAARLRRELGEPEPGLGDPIAHLRGLAERLGVEAAASAEATGDVDRAGPDELAGDYWYGRYRGLLIEAAEVIGAPEAAAADLIERFAAAFKSETTS